jgi:hypothetical protein
VERTPRRTQTSVGGGGGKDESIFRKRDLGYGVEQRIVHHTKETPRRDDWCGWDRIEKVDQEKTKIGGRDPVCKAEGRQKDGDCGRDKEKVLCGREPNIQMELR